MNMFYCHSFGFAAVIALVSACDTNSKEQSDVVQEKCTRVGEMDTICANISYDGCDHLPCYPACTERGDAAAEFSETCGKLWLETYSCIETMTCDGFDDWHRSATEDDVSYPCLDAEEAFRKTCTGVALFPSEPLEP